MSDYLSSLAARSLDPAGTAVRPRLASRFEPLPSTVAAPLRMEPPEEGPGFEDTVEVVSPEPPRARRTPRRPDVAEEVEPLQSPAARIATPRRRNARRENEPEQEILGLEIRSPEPLESGAWQHRLSPHLPGPPLPASLPAAGRGGRTAEEAGPSSPLSPGGREGGWEREGWESEGPRRQGSAIEVEPLASQPPPKVLAAEPSSPLRRDPDARTPVKAKTDAAPILQPRVTVVEREPFPVPREERAPAPTIQVTIGRIEVRATPPPAQPSRPRPTAPSALSLEEYLRRRSKGGDG